MVDRAVAPRTDHLEAEIARLNERISHVQEEGAAERVDAGNALGALSHQLEDMKGQVAQVRGIAAGVFDDIPALRRALLAARASPDYERALSDPEPLVTIRIPTYVRSRSLVERALPSIARQTHQNFEVIVVGDGCTNDTAERIEAFGDPRVRFVNLPYRHPYPEDRTHRWMVAGAPGVNVGTELGTGSWLAMLGDDDEFEPHHLERLLDTARATRAELVYGHTLCRNRPPEPDQTLNRYPPELGWFGFQSAIFMRALSFFEFSTQSWLLDEPSDWNLARRMIAAGVRIGFVDDVVIVHYPSRSWEPDSYGL
jgi:hypothetical protein